MANLYKLAKEYQELENAFLASVDEETGEVDIDIATAIEKAQGTFEEKAIAVATVFRNLETYSEDIAEEIKRLQAIKKRVEREKDRVEDYLTQACEMTGTESLRGVYANISFRNNPLHTVIDDESLLPEEYFIVKTEKKPNLTAIKEAIKSGKEVQGAHLESERKICIK